ncbi:IclR family transcriptional regulator [Umezawaea tangerina]|uniref:IclR family transcriptional regulator n=1 Tax=Umezawaea tangerina TaxID=84725 RepID=A0A2T0TG87_9PSEU|nr:IclR family transcriptional regulator [Umezawaea tangerina]PRY44674.1 IclR family transcriptional regulator [Umezawaea tangerina]
MPEDPPAPRGRKPARGEPVVDRALRLLAAFREKGDALSLGRLSERAGLPKATTLRLARRLAEWGALERTDDGDFVIGLRLLEVASLSPRGHGLREAVLPFMEDLHHATGQHVLLAVREDREAVLVERLSAHRAGTVLYRVGGRIPLHATGVGLVLLAHAPADLQEAVLDGELSLPDEPQDLTADELRRTLARVRRDGVAVASLRRPEAMSSVAAPIHDSRRAVVAALSVVAPTASVRAAALAPAVVAVARAASRALQRDGARTGPSPDRFDG